MQIKSTRQYHLTPVRMTIIGKDKRHTLAAIYTAGGNVNQQGHFGKKNEGVSKLKVEPWNLLWGIDQKEMKSLYQKNKTLYSYASSQHWLQQPRKENKLSVHQLIENEDIPSVCLHSGMLFAI